MLKIFLFLSLMASCYANSNEISLTFSRYSYNKELVEYFEQKLESEGYKVVENYERPNLRFTFQKHCSRLTGYNLNDLTCSEVTYNVYLNNLIDQWYYPLTIKIELDKNTTPETELESFIKSFSDFPEFKFWQTEESEKLKVYPEKKRGFSF